MIQLEKWRYCFLWSFLCCCVIIVAAQLVPTIPVVAPTKVQATFIWNSVQGAQRYLIQWTTNTSIWPKNQFIQAVATNVITGGEFEVGKIYYARIRVSEPQPGSYFTVPIMFNVAYTKWSSSTNLVALTVESADIGKTNWQSQWVIVLTNSPGAKQFRTRAFKP